MIFAQLIGLNLLEIYLEKARYLHSQGLFEESLKFLVDLKRALPPAVLDKIPASVCEKIIDAETTVFLAIQGEYSLCAQSLATLSHKDKTEDEYRLIARHCILLSFSFYHLEIYEVDEAIRLANEVLDFFESLSFENTIYNYFLTEKIAFTESLIARGYFIKGNLHIAIEFSSSSYQKYVEYQNVRLASILNVYGRILRAFGHIDRSMKIMEQAIILSLSTFNHVLLPSILNNIGTTYMVIGQYQKAERTFQKAQISCDDVFAYNTKTSVDANLGELTLIRGKLIEAEYSLTETLKVARRVPSLKQVEIKCLINLGKLSLLRRKYPQAARYFESALQIMDFLKIQKDMPELLANYARTLLFLRNYEITEELINRAKTIAGSIGQEDIYPMILITEGMFYQETNGTKDLKALDLFLMASAKAKDQKNHFATLESAMYLAEYYLTGDQPKYELAKAYLNEAIKLALEGGILPLMVRGYLLSATINATELNFGYALSDIEQAEITARKASLEIESNDIHSLKQRIMHQLPYVPWISESSDIRDPSLTLSLIFRMTQRIPTTGREAFSFFDLLSEISLLMYHFTSTGPNLYYAANDTNLDKLTISNLGVLLTMMIGQGHSYFEGLYGPLPLQKSNSLVLCYTTFLLDPNNTDPRFGGQNFIVYALVYPNEVERTLLYDRRRLVSILNEYCAKYTSVSQWDVTKLEDLRKACVEE